MRTGGLCDLAWCDAGVYTGRGYGKGKLYPTIYTGRSIGKEIDMKRQVTMEEISDGKLYTSNDLVKADCGDCEGCHACCTGMGSSIVLDPLDIVRISRGTGAALKLCLQERLN